MLLSLLLPMLIIIVGLCTYSYLGSRNVLNKEITQNITSLSQNGSDEIYKLLKEKEVLLEVTSKVLSEKEMTQAERINFFKQLKTSISGVNSVFDGYEDKTCTDSQGVTIKEKPAGYDPTTRVWYTLAKSSNDIAYTPIFETTNTKKLTVDISRKIIRNGQMVGVTGVDMDINKIRDLASSFKVGNTGYVGIIDDKGKFIYHPDFDLTENILEVNNGNLKDYASQIMSNQSAVIVGPIDNKDMIISSSSIGTTGWKFIVFAPKSELFKDVNTLTLNSIITAIIGLVLVGAIIIVITNKLLNPIKDIKRMAENIASGDLRIDTEPKLYQNSNDEIHNLMYSFYNMRMKLSSLISNVNNSTNEVAQSAENFTESSQQSAEASSSVASSITHLVEENSNQVQAINEAVLTIERISNNIKNVADNANSMVSIADEAAKATSFGQQSINDTIRQMDSVNQAAKRAQLSSNDMESSSKQIGKIVEMISSIAEQTNLLALNAAIEAARAGESGKGFAVVAEEVRKLAEQSDQAAKQVSILVTNNYKNIDNMVTSIDNAISNVSQGIDRVNSAGGEFNRISMMVTDLVKRIKEISLSLDEISNGSQKVVIAINDVDKISKETAAEFENVSAAVEEQSAAMHEIASSCTNLKDLADKLDAEIHQFKL
ncbi:methyl-accepting chemotaxis protein [Clostridium beijerinckii]|uniref:Methyl-accepting chemotaxis protein n=2 Tax=Clostridium beijerinckii TaxID=1520 RepID=A0AAE5H9Q4_CLOBE|nr:methyl-accepting chemotaxis protein [Clostridium beijerinckii]NSB17149.1 methyl-accepting chemotaxis protein [Clostridium beijerinckii]